VYKFQRIMCCSLLCSRLSLFSLLASVVSISAPSSVDSCQVSELRNFFYRNRSVVDIQFQTNGFLQDINVNNNNNIFNLYRPF
jgi:hypothetical protein